MIYLIIFILLLYLSYQYDVRGVKSGWAFWYRTILVVFILLAGLRYRLSMDTPNYIYKFFHDYPTIDKFSLDDYPIGKDPLWVIINALVKTAFGKYYVVQIIQAAFVNILIFRYIRKHSQFVFSCLFFYYLLCYVGYSMEIMRGAMSIVVCLYANDYIMERKWIKGGMLYFVGLLFHAQTILMFLVPFLYFLKLNRVGILILFGTFIVGHIIQEYMGDFFLLFGDIDSVSEKASYYSASDQIEGRGNLNYKIVNIYPSLLYTIFAFSYLKRYSGQCKLLRFEPFIMLGLIFVVLQLNVQLISRYVDYFRMYFILIYAECFVEMVRKGKVFKPVLSYMRVMIVFFPFCFLTIYGLLRSESSWLSINPYYSVITREVSKERESFYLKSDRPRARDNEY